MFSRSFWLLLLLFFNLANAQNVIPRFETLGVEEGLSQSSIYGIYQDKKGFMWFGTADGLNRYDGSEVKVFKVDQQKVKQANSNFIRGNIKEDKNGNIWYSNETGIYYYSPVSNEINLAHLYSKQEGQGYIFDLIDIDLNDIIWLFNPARGIASFNIAQQKLIIYPFPSVVDAKDINYSQSTLDHTGNIWFIANVNHGMINFNTKTCTYDLSTFEHIQQKVVATAGNYTITIKNTGNEVDEINIHLHKVLKQSIPVKNIKISNMGIFKFHVDFMGRLWITTVSEGLLMYDPQENKLHQFTHDISKQKSLPINFTRVLYEDSHHNLWIGTDGGGVCKVDLKPPKFKIFPMNEGDHPFIKDYFIKCFFEDNDKNIWFGTLSNGICKLNPFTGKLTTIGTTDVKPGKFSTAATGTIFKDSKGNIWVGSSMGIGLYNKSKNDFTPIHIKTYYPLQPFSTFVYQIEELPDGTYLASTSQGLVHIAKTKTGYKTIAHKERFFGIVQITSIKCIGNDIWYCSPINGLYHIQNVNGQFKFVETLVENIDLRGITKDEQDSTIIWVASSVGLIKLNTLTKQHHLYNHNNGLKNSYIYGILEDSSHNLWMSTNGGIAVFNKKTEQFTNYTSKDGLQSNEFNTGAYYKSSSGTLYFGGIKGFNWFKPGDLLKESILPKVSIAQIWINDTALINDSDYYFHQKIRLPYYKNDIALNIAALDFTKPEANKIEYQLNGWENSPIVSYNKQIRYSNLPPGNYTFTVRSCNVDGVWSKPTSISIIITPPFWNTWWFYLLISIAVVTIIMSFARYVYQSKLKHQIKELEKQKALEEERERISREMHDDIGAGLTRIALMSEVAKRSFSSKKELEDIAGTSRQLMDSIGEIIWSLDSEYKSLEHLLNYLREQLNQLLEPSGINYKIDFPNDTNDILLSNDQKRNILLITKEIVHNAVKHSKANYITISASVNDGSLKMKIIDDGQGFSLQQQSTGNGLKNLQHRFQQLKADFLIETEIGKGVLVSYSIPLKSHS